MSLSGFLGQEFPDISPHGQSVVDDLLKDLDHLIGPEQTEDHLEVRDVSAWDQPQSPIVSPIEESGSRSMQFPTQQPDSARRPTSPLPLPFFPPLKNTPEPTLGKGASKKKGRMQRAWDRLKQMFVKKFLGADQGPHKLSDKLVPERDSDEVKLNEVLAFSKPRPT